MNSQIGTRLIKLEPKGNFARIIPLGDLHCGNRGALLEEFQGYVNYIKKTPDTWAIIMSDMMENVLPSTVAKYPGSMFDQCMTPEEQRVWVKKVLEPIAPKIIGWLDGNHNMRSWYMSQMSPEKEIAKELGIRWFGLDALIDVQVGKNHYTIHATHGVGSAISAAAVAQKMQQQARIFYGADIYLRGHHHQKFVYSDCAFDARRGVARKIYYVCIGSFLGYINTYIHRSSGKPSALGTVKIKLYKGDWDIHVTA